MTGIDLWNPAHTTLGLDILTAFLLGIVHGVTPDEHTWPITFSYAVGGYSTRQGLRAGLTFSLAFALQRALASELAYLGLAGWFRSSIPEAAINLVVGLLMAAAGYAVMRHGRVPHLHLPERGRTGINPWWPAVHGFVAGWGIGPFAVIIYTVLAPAMPSAAWGWVPGAAYGLGTTVVQAAAGALFGFWAARRLLPEAAIARIALRTAARTLLWGGCALMLLGAIDGIAPRLGEFAIATGLRVHNLDTIGLPAILTLVAIAAASSAMVAETRAARRAATAHPASRAP